MQAKKEGGGRASVIDADLTLILPSQYWSGSHPHLVLLLLLPPVDPQALLPVAPQPTNCLDVAELGLLHPGEYEVEAPAGPGGGSLKVRCHDGWTVLLARGQDGLQDFSAKTWDDYENGFGLAADGEYWMGLRNIYKYAKHVCANCYPTTK